MKKVENMEKIENIIKYRKWGKKWKSKNKIEKIN